MAPIVKLMFRNQKHELELAEQKIASQEEMIVEVTKDRDFLWEKLSQCLDIICTTLWILETRSQP